MTAVPPRPDAGFVPSSAPSRRRRWVSVLLGFTLGVATAVWIIGFLLYAGHDHPGGFINDRAFVEAADAACRTAFSTYPSPAGADASYEERARAVERGHARLVALVDELAAIPVHGSGDETRWWIARWRQLLAVGPEYAAALRSGDSDVYGPIGDLGDEPARDTNAFAENNGIDACVA